MTYKAILIGNWTYDQAKTGLQSLNGPQEDLQVLRGALTDDNCGLFKPDDVTLVPDKDEGTVREKLADFLEKADKDDALLIYFSGHAAPFRDRLYLCMKETNPNNPSVKGLDFGFINTNLPESRSEHTIIILDCCYAGQSTKGSGTVNLSFAQNLYCVASSGAYDLTPDAKSTGAASPFTVEFARLLIDPDIVPDDRGAVTMDAVWDKLEKCSTKPVRSTVGRRLVIAKRGDLRDGDEQPLNPLEWLPKHPKINQVDLLVSTERIEAKWERNSAVGRHLDTGLRHFISRGLELLDGVGRLKNDDLSEQWQESVDHFWRRLGSTLMASTVPVYLREYIADRLANQSDDELVKIAIHSTDQPHAQSGVSDEDYPWEALNRVDEDPKSSFLSLTEGLVLERVCEVSKSLPEKSDAKLSYAIWSPHLSPQDQAVSGQIVKELNSRRADLSLDTTPTTLLGTDCNWNRFLNAPLVQLLVLTLPLRRLNSGAIEVCFNSQNKPDWKSSEDVLKRLQRWQARLKGVVIETVATYPSFNAHAAGVGFARQVTKAGLGPAAYLCHPPGFLRYPSDDRNVPVTFAGQLVCALVKNAEFPVALHHARNAPLRLDPSIKEAFGFPGYYWPKAAPGASGAGRLGAPSTTSPSSGSEKGDVKRGPRT